MPDQPVDRRVRRTKRRLKEALLELIEERDYDRITIEQITHRADVGRSTFYSHYSDKDDLLFSGFDRWLLSLAEEMPHTVMEDGERACGADRFRFSLPLLRHIGAQKRFFQATIAGGSNARVRRKTTALLVDVVCRELDRVSAPGRQAARSRDTNLEPERLREARAHGVIGAFLALASWWLDRSDNLSPEAVNEVFQDLLRQSGLR